MKKIWYPVSAAPFSSGVSSILSFQAVFYTLYQGDFEVANLPQKPSVYIMAWKLKSANNNKKKGKKLWWSIRVSSVYKKIFRKLCHRCLQLFDHQAHLYAFLCMFAIIIFCNLSKLCNLVYETKFILLWGYIDYVHIYNFHIRLRIHGCQNLKSTSAGAKNVLMILISSVLFFYTGDFGDTIFVIKRCIFSWIHL